MANKQTRWLKKQGLKSVNGGANTTISPIAHGSWAFQEPAVAVGRKRNYNVRSWKVTKNHPSQPQPKKGQGNRPTLSRGK